MRHDQIVSLRHTPNKSALLFLTERCPVGCRHCSVDSRPRSTSIQDWALFESLVVGLAGSAELEVVGVSGGEPFSEPEGLVFAVDLLSQAHKAVVLYTSGEWGGKSEEGWIRDILRRVKSVVISTDSFHRERLPSSVVNEALRACAQRGAWIILQVLEEPEALAIASEMLREALGSDWDTHSEICTVPLLPYGRGRRLTREQWTKPLSQFGRCSHLGSPVVRFDGVVAACCNETVITGKGSGRLRSRCRNGDSVLEVLKQLFNDPMNRAMRTMGPSGISKLPAFRELANTPCASVCDACWLLHDHACGMGGSDAESAMLMIELVSVLAEGGNE